MLNVPNDLSDTHIRLPVHPVFDFVLGLLDPEERAIVAGVNQQWRDGVASSPHPFTAWAYTLPLFSST